MISSPHDKAQNPFDKFKEAARELETGDDETCFGKWMRKLVKQKPGDKEKSGGHGG